MQIVLNFHLNLCPGLTICACNLCFMLLQLYLCLYSCKLSCKLYFISLQLFYILHLKLSLCLQTILVSYLFLQLLYILDSFLQTVLNLHLLCNSFLQSILNFHLNLCPRLTICTCNLCFMLLQFYLCFYFGKLFIPYKLNLHLWNPLLLSS